MDRQHMSSIGYAVEDAGSKCINFAIIDDELKVGRMFVHYRSTLQEYTQQKRARCLLPPYVRTHKGLGDAWEH